MANIKKNRYHFQRVLHQYLYHEMLNQWSKGGSDCSNRFRNIVKTLSVTLEVSLSIIGMSGAHNASTVEICKFVASATETLMQLKYLCIFVVSATARLVD